MKKTNTHKLTKATFVAVKALNKNGYTNREIAKTVRISMGSVPYAITKDMRSLRYTNDTRRA